MKFEPELIIFDHDGVLVDSEILAMELLANLASAHGVPTTIPAAFDRYLGTSFDFVVDDLRSSGAVVNRDKLHEDFHAALFEDFRTRLQEIPGTTELLRALTEDSRRVSIASSGSRERVTLGITTTGINHYFSDSVITTAEDADRGKPFPDLFLVTAERAGVEPRNCLVIEDSPFGIEAARRAGMSSIGLAFRTPADKLTDADLVVNTPSEILFALGM
jgi:HAD superfamily hydrolase (TIGR01509 family)